MLQGFPSALGTPQEATGIEVASKLHRNGDGHKILSMYLTARFMKTESIDSSYSPAVRTSAFFVRTCFTCFHVLYAMLAVFFCAIDLVYCCSSQRMQVLGKILGASSAFIYYP